MEYLSKSEKDTYAIATSLANQASGGDIFALVGDLGSGKTTFVKGFAKAIGITQEITSPTFVILKEYRLPAAFNNIQFLVHVDCYRLETKEDAESVGLTEYFSRKDVVILMEWPEKIQSLVPKTAKVLQFEYLNENERKVKV